MRVDDNEAQVSGMRDRERAAIIERHREGTERPRAHDTGGTRAVVISRRREARHR